MVDWYHWYQSASRGARQSQTKIELQKVQSGRCCGGVQLFALWSLFDSSEAEARGAVEKAAAAAAAADVIFQPWLDPEPSQRNVAWWEE